METNKPNIKLAAKTLPKGLFLAVKHVFTHTMTNGTTLVGGTALAGFYANHRTSDDMDLFTRNSVSQKATIAAVKSLKTVGARIENEGQSPLYYHADCLFKDHRFTIDVVEDENLFNVGEFHTTNKVCVASLKTILQMKLATLVSRCSEKDLFDIKWLFENFYRPSVEEWISLGNSIDGGVNTENLLASIAGSQLRKDACGFSKDRTRPTKILQSLNQFKKEIVGELLSYVQNTPTPALGKIIKKAKRILK